MRPRFRRGKQPRLKPDYMDTYHHCYNRIAGVPGDYPFGPLEKEKFIEMNCVRAGLVTDPADYRFGTFGMWSATGKHPFARELKRHLKDAWAEYAHVNNLQDLYMKMRRELARAIAEDAGKDAAEVAAAEQAAARPLPFSIKLDRRVRYWLDGLVIGSQLYVTETMIRARGEPCMRKRRLTRCADHNKLRPQHVLYAFKRLTCAA